MWGEHVNKEFKLYVLRFTTDVEIRSSTDMYNLVCAALQDGDQIALGRLRRHITDIVIYNAEFKN